MKARSASAPRFEDEIRIELICCYKKPMELKGNLSLRGPADATRLGYECKTCHRQVMVMDAWPLMDAATYVEQDNEDD
jgi:hypothetical protein